MENNKFMEVFSNPFGISIFLIVSLGFLYQSFYRFSSQDTFLGITNTIGFIGFLSTTIFLFENRKKICKLKQKKVR